MGFNVFLPGARGSGGPQKVPQGPPWASVGPPGAFCRPPRPNTTKANHQPPRNQYALVKRSRFGELPTRSEIILAAWVGDLSPPPPRAAGGRQIRLGALWVSRVWEKLRSWHECCAGSKTHNYDAVLRELNATLMRAKLTPNNYRDREKRKHKHMTNNLDNFELAIDKTKVR